MTPAQPTVNGGPAGQEEMDVDRPLRIMLVSARFAPYVGGTEIHTGEVAAELARRGHEVTVLTTKVSDSMPDTDEVDGVDVVRVPAYPHWSDLYFAPQLRRAVSNSKVDVVHVQGYHTTVAPLALAAAQQAGIPTAVTFHSGGHSSKLRNLLRPIQVLAMRRLLLRADSLVAVSRFEAELFSKWLGIDVERIEIIPNGVSNPRRCGTNGDVASHVDGAPSSPPTILSMGRLVRYKGHHRVIKAMPYVLRSIPDARLLILGQGPYEQRLRQLATKVGVADHVHFDYVPSHERDRLHSILTDASMAVLLSDYESQGLVAHEALAAGLPLVVMDKAALSELVAAGLAQAAPPASTDQEVAAIVTRSLRAATAEKAGSRRCEPTSPLSGNLAPTGWAEITDRLEERYRRIVAPQRLNG